MKKLLLILSLVCMIGVLFLFESINKYYVSENLIFDTASIVADRYYLTAKNDGNAIEVSRIQWWYTNIVGLMLLFFCVILMFVVFYLGLRYVIPYFYYRKYENIYD